MYFASSVRILWTRAGWTCATKLHSRMLAPQHIAVFSSIISAGDEEFEIPRHKVTTAFARSSGAGGQNVNKLNTKAEVRFNVDKADWLDDHIKGRIRVLNPHAVTRDGDLVVTSQRHRTQAGNLEDAFEKLQELISEAAVIPKVRELKSGPTEHAKTVWKEEKRKRSDVKARRGSKGSWDD